MDEEGGTWLICEDRKHMFSTPMEVRTKRQECDCGSMVADFSANRITLDTRSDNSGTEVIRVHYVCIEEA